MTELHRGRDLDTFPEPGNGRVLYFAELPEATKDILEERGYKVVYLSQLPRGTPSQERAYLLKKVQGIEVGTVQMNEAQEAALRLLFKHTGLLDEKRGGEQEEAKTEEKVDVDELLEVARNKQSRLRSDDTSFGRDVKEMLDEL
jgi:hypothetical protein